MKITCLVENVVFRGGLHAEHGLSFHIDTGNKSLLFDTGQTNAFIKNAPKLGIDVEQIDTVILSHGHYDHTGGITHFLSSNKKAKIYAKPQALFPKYNGKKSIGFEGFENISPERLVLIEKTTEIAPGVNIITDIPLAVPSDTDWKYFFTEKNSNLIADTFEDELFLTIVNDEKLSVLSSCSHRGITNIMRKALTEFPLPVNLIAGGFHLKDCKPQRVETIIDYFKTIAPEKIGICHCTGLEHFQIFYQAFGDAVFYFHTGIIIHI